jgi:hypothetical protein
VSRSMDEPDIGEVKGLLRRLETTSQTRQQGAPSFSAEAPRPARTQQGPSSAATLFLIANTMMTTATMTSIAWYLFHSSEMQKGRQGAPAGAVAWPPQSVEVPPSAPAAPAPPARPVAYLVAPDTLDVEPGKPLRPSIQLVPREAIASIDHVSVRGLPSDMIFNAGSRVGADSWAVPVGMLPELELLSAPSARSGRHQLVLSARGADGRDLAGATLALVVGAAASPASAAPTETSSTTPALDSEMQASYLAKARDLLTIGQVSSARLLLQRAAESGNPEAALSLGDTYDPAFLFELGARGLTGDIGKASFWYRKAEELGSPDAKARIEKLKRS